MKSLEFAALKRGEEREILKDNIVSVFDQVARVSDRIAPGITSRFGEELARRCRVQPGDCVLDVGSGCGGVLFELGVLTGSPGSVLGVDLSQKMVNSCRTEAKHRALNHVEMYNMDAESLNLPDDYFDAVTCGLSLPLFPRPGKALSEMVRVLKPGGVFGASTWAMDGEYLLWLMDLYSLYCPSRVKRARSVFEEQCGISCLDKQLTGLNMEPARVEKVSHTFFFADEKEWWEVLWSCEFRGLLNTMPGPALHRFKRQAMLEVGRMKSDRGIQVPLGVNLIVSRKKESD